MSDWTIYLAVLIAAAAHAVWNFLVKANADQLLTTAGIRLFGLLGAMVLLAFFPWPGIEAVPFLAGQVAFSCAYYFFLLNSYRLGEFSSVYPIARGIAPIAVLAAAALFQLDSISMGEILATLIIALGIVLFAFNYGVSRASIGYAVATGLMIGSYTLLGGLGVRQSESAVGYLAWTELLIGLVVVPVCWFLRRGSIAAHFGQNWPTLLAGACLSVGAFGTVLWAFQTLPLGPTTAIRETSVAFAVLLGVFFLHEKLSRVKLIALVLVLVGTMLLALDR